MKDMNFGLAAITLASVILSIYLILNIRRPEERKRCVDIPFAHAFAAFAFQKGYFKGESAKMGGRSVESFSADSLEFEREFNNVFLSLKSGVTSIDVQTSGDNSPAIVSPDSSVNINYSK